MGGELTKDFILFLPDFHQYIILIAKAKEGNMPMHKDLIGTIISLAVITAAEILLTVLISSEQEKAKELGSIRDNLTLR